MKIRKFPGKLYLMGEYFITQENGEAIIMAVDRFIETETSTSDTFQLKSDYGSINGIDISSPNMNVALEAVKITYDYLDYIKVPTFPLNLNLKSNLLEDGVKIGLGSSAVVIVAIVQSILESHNVFLDKLKLFKLAVLCQKRLGDLSSGGDLAASIFSGLVYYKKYDDHVLTNMSSFDVLDKEWPSLKIDSLRIPSELKIMVGWTKKSNKTDDYLKIFNKKIIEDPNTYKNFTKRALVYVKMFIEGNYKEAVSNYRDLMLDLQAWTNLDIETVKLKKGIELSIVHGASSKVSGSGGGDCMIAIEPTNKKNLIDSWKNNNIKYLDIGVWNNDAISKKR